MRYRYSGPETTYHPQLGRLDPGAEGAGPDEIVTLCIAGGLLEPVEDGPAAEAPDEEGRA